MLICIIITQMTGYHLFEDVRAHLVNDEAQSPCDVLHVSKVARSLKSHKCFVQAHQLSRLI